MISNCNCSFGRKFPKVKTQFKRNRPLEKLVDAQPWVHSFLGFKVQRLLIKTEQRKAIFLCGLKQSIKAL